MYIFFCPQDFDLLDNLLDIGQTTSAESTSYVIFIYAISVKTNTDKDSFIIYL